MNKEDINRYLQALAHVYQDLGGGKLKLGICGGAALSLTGLVKRPTQDIDLLFPLELPSQFWEACRLVAQEYELPDSWINQGPKDLTTFGLPHGFEDRAIQKIYGAKLTCLFASRLDQIHFKVYASVDRGGYHVQDLLQLFPISDEILQAAQWCRTHDPSLGFETVLKSMLTQLGFSDVAQKL